MSLGSFKKGSDAIWLNFIKITLAAMWWMDGKGGKNGDLSLVGQMIDNGDVGINSRNCEKRSREKWEMRKRFHYHYISNTFLDSKYMSFDLNLASQCLFLPPSTPMFSNSRRQKESQFPFPLVSWPFRESVDSDRPKKFTSSLFLIEKAVGVIFNWETNKGLDHKH